jgi:hypothetical protein
MLNNKSNADITINLFEKISYTWPKKEKESRPLKVNFSNDIWTTF